MSQPADLILRSQRVLTPNGLEPKAIWVKDGKIERITSADDPLSAVVVEDVGHRVVMPGLVDTHVHINEPGRTEWEGFETATRAAAAGGITTLVDMPLNCIPVTTTAHALALKTQSAKPRLWVDCGFYGGLVAGNVSELLPLAQAGVLGFKAFMIHSGIDDFPHVGESDLRQAMPVIAKTGLPLLVHAELESPLPDAPAGNPHQYAEFLASRPRAWEMDAIRLMIQLAEEYQCRVHIVHLSCADALGMLADARKRGVPITVETCPHYLVFHSESIPDGDTRYKCTPPIREMENADRLWQGLRDGVIDFVISDHSPCEPALKRMEMGDFQEAWGGIASLQFGLSSIWQAASQRGFGLEDLCRWMCERPAQFVGLGAHKGRIEVGYDADWVVWDPDATFKLAADRIEHRHKVTPYEGRTLQGEVYATYLRGQRIYKQGRFAERPTGQCLLRSELGVTV